MPQLTEHISKTLLARFGVPVGPSRLAGAADAAAQAAAELGFPVAVKAQVPVSGRGKAGGILRADTGEQAAEAFRRIREVQFGELRASEALVEPYAAVDRELYLAVVVDATASGSSILFSAGGGVDVEAGDGVVRLPVRADGTVPGRLLREAAYAAGVDGRVTERLVRVAQALLRAFHALDSQVVELNPLAVVDGGALLALDARVIVDDNALFRQPEVHALSRLMPVRRDDAFKAATRLDYVELAGSIGLISGGAGMTMAVMDMIEEHGGRPACFLDCSANPTEAGYGAAIDLLLELPHVTAILISIFGGLTQMERVAKSLVRVLAERNVDKPLTVRLMGTNIEAAEAILEDAGLANHSSLEDAVRAAVESERAVTSS